MRIPSTSLRAGMIRAAATGAASLAVAWLTLAGAPDHLTMDMIIEDARTLARPWVS